MDANEAVVFPENLSSLSLDELAALSTQALAEFDTLAENAEIDDDGVARLETLAAGLEGIEAARSALVAKTTSAASRSDTLSKTRDRIGKLRPVAPTTVDAPTDGEAAAVEGDENIDADADKPSAKPSARRGSLATAQDRAPRLAAPNGGADGALSIVAAAATTGIPIGTPLTDLDMLTSAVQGLARSLSATHGTPSFQMVASVNNNFEYVLDGENTKPGEFEEMMRQIRTPDRIDDLVAAGGWCAPSETRYDFFNIACEDGMVDVPTVGIRRGGVRWPVSPSMADVFTGEFTNATNPWVWTEADDILAVTGSPTKPCVRVPCATLDEARLECYGICLTAGNLTDSAWPEATRNYLRLLMSAHYHAMNQRYIQQMVTLSTTAIAVPTGACRAISTDLPDTVGLAAQDYRTRYGMCDDDVLEVVLPRWARDAIRSDLSRRTGVDPTSFSNADIDRLFSTRRVRIQWVSDWQIRTAGQPGGATALTAWPDTVDFMIYAAGTFFRGNGMTLDLGVVRDSVLNSTNDHTAAWTEECHLIGRHGHESRLYRLPVCVGGLTGGTCTECHVA